MALVSESSSDLGLGRDCRDVLSDSCCSRCPMWRLLVVYAGSTCLAVKAARKLSVSLSSFSFQFLLSLTPVFVSCCLEVCDMPLVLILDFRHCNFNFGFLNRREKNSHCVLWYVDFPEMGEICSCLPLISFFLVAFPELTCLGVNFQKSGNSFCRLRVSDGMSGDPSDREEGVGYDDNDQGTAEASVEFHVVRSSRANFLEAEEVGTSQPRVSKKSKGKDKTADVGGRPDDRDIKASRCTVGFLDAVRVAFSIPEEYELSVIPEGQRLNNTPPANTIMLTLEHLQSGIRFPLSEEYQRLSAYFKVPLSQIHPNGVRHYSCFLKLCQRTGVVDSMRLFCCLYLLSLKDQNHFAYIRFRGERKDVPGGLFTGITDSLRDFKEDYFRVTHPTAFRGMINTWSSDCHKPDKWFHTPSPFESADIAKLRDATPDGKKAHADVLCPKILVHLCVFVLLLSPLFFYFSRFARLALICCFIRTDLCPMLLSVNSIDVSRLAGKKRKRPANRAPAPAPAPMARAAATAATPEASGVPRPEVPENAAPAVGVSPVPLRVQLPGGIEVPVSAEPVGTIPFINLDSTGTVDGPVQKEAAPRGDVPKEAGPSSKGPRASLADLPPVSSDSSTAASGPQTITRASFAEWVSRHNDGARATLNNLPIAGDVARVTTLPIDLAHYKTHRPENLLAVVSSLCLQAAQVSYLADQNANKNEVDLLLAKNLLLSEQAKVRSAEKRAADAEKKASDGAALVAKLELQLKNSEDRRSEDLEMLGKLRNDVSRLETEKAAEKEDFSKQLADVTRRNELASQGLRSSVEDLKKKLADAVARADKAEVQVTEGATREENLYEDFRKMLYVGEVQVGEFIRGRFGADVDVSDFKLDVVDLHRRAKDLPEDYDIPADIEDYLADDQGEGPN
ncbi:uncharacterized protein LOC126668696 [Mercurialis annua]|uniref:uncharacterized protein LOC126668696 n=1 Tax=Mercurialis annua TaxID=3986 RepID=UPI00215EBD01|nr:uncharacterized protein LOC126668696 [Mercurialis annua]